MHEENMGGQTPPKFLGPRYFFDIEIARYTECVHSAILYELILSIIKTHHVNRLNSFNGKTWMLTSSKHLCEELYFIKHDEVMCAYETLINKNLISDKIVEIDGVERTYLLLSLVDETILPRMPIL